MNVKRFQGVRVPATANPEVPPESIGKRTKPQSTATKKIQAVRQKPRTKDRAAAYRCAWHKNKDKFIILAK